MARSAKKEKKLTIEEKLEQALVPEAEQPYPVPENWCWVRLSSLVTPSKDRTGVFTNSLTRYVGLEHMEKGGGIVSFGSAEGLKSQKNVFAAGQVLYGKLRPYLNKHDIADFEGVCSTDILVFEVMKSTYSRFVNYYLDLPYFIEYAVSHSKGINLPRVSESVILNAAVPLPPLAEQQRIVDRIESLFSKLDAAKEKAQAVVDGFDNRKAAILHKAFTGELTVKWRMEQKCDLNQWKTMKVREIGDVVTGSTPSTKEKSYYGGSIPFIKPTELNQGKQIITSAETLTEHGKQVSRPVRKGSTCVCCIGATISKCGLLRVDAVTNQQINTIMPYDYMDDTYVYYYCSGNGFRDVLIKNSSATTLPIINKGRMAELPVVVPPKREQEEIVRILDSFFAKEDSCIDVAKIVIDNIDSTKQSILLRAFRGELSTYDSDDEQAILCLKRVLQE